MWLGATIFKKSFPFFSWLYPSGRGWEQGYSFFPRDLLSSKKSLEEQKGCILPLYSLHIRFTRCLSQKNHWGRSGFLKQILYGPQCLSAKTQFLLFWLMKGFLWPFLYCLSLSLSPYLGRNPAENSDHISGCLYTSLTYFLVMWFIFESSVSSELPNP